jgi:CRP-like cAMP-binding protein
MSPGRVVDIAALNERAYTSSVDALAPTSALAVDKGAWRACLAAEPRVALRHDQSLTERSLSATQTQGVGIEPRPVERVAALRVLGG